MSSNSATRVREEHDAIVEELGKMVDEGLLEMGVTESGEAVYWPTDSGCVTLGMDP